ncbi:MAG: thiamine diphosphokinase [Lachnospiraceae bacterium]
MSNESICILFGAGEAYGQPKAPSPGDFVIAADGGLTYALGCGITPDLVVGDFDSLKTPPDNGLNTIQLPREKDDTDMVAALYEGWQRGFRVFHIYGGTGGRLDHTLANMQCVAELASRGGRGYLFDKDTVITAIWNCIIRFSADARGTISVFSHSETAFGVNERGLKYSLVDATLYNIRPLGISNEFTGEPSSISVREGTLVIIYPQNTQEITT